MIIIKLVSWCMVDILKPQVLQLWLSSYLPQCYLNDQWVGNENLWVESMHNAPRINAIVIIVLKVVILHELN